MILILGKRTGCRYEYFFYILTQSLQFAHVFANFLPRRNWHMHKGEGKKYLRPARVKVRTPCQNFGQLPVKLKSKFLHWIFLTVVHELSVLKLFSFRMCFFLFLFFYITCLHYLQTLCLLRNSMIPNTHRQEFIVFYLGL